VTTKHPKVQQRQGEFASRPVTRIWQEQETATNPYLAESCRCHGYDLFELMQHRRFVEVLLLLFQGELPTPEQTDLMEALMIACINPGPRHPAGRAAMNAGVSRSNTAHILPIALSVMGGTHLGGEEVVAAMRFFQAQQERNPAEVAGELLAAAVPPRKGDWHIAPGFGSRFGDIDPLATALASQLHEKPGCGHALHWGDCLAQELRSWRLGWLSPGIAAAVFIDLGLPPRAGAGLFQLLCAPGLLAHGLEMADKPITAMPFLDKEHYVIAAAAQKN